MSKLKKTLVALGLLFIGYVGFRYAWHHGTVAYFKNKCETYGGEFIYKTVDNVEGIYQRRLRDPRDYFDRLSKHDIPEDPYGHTNWEAQNPETLFIAKDIGYSFLETQKSPNLHDRRYPITKLKEKPEATGEKYWRYSVVTENGENLLVAENVSKLKSEFGFTWREVRSFWDRLFGVWGGELVITKLDDKEELAVRKGFFYQNWFSKRMSICPRGKDVNTTFLFVSKVLRPKNLRAREENGAAH